MVLFGAPGGGNADRSALLAGGADLLTLMKADLLAPGLPIDIERLARNAYKIPLAKPLPRQALMGLTAPTWPDA